MIRHILLWILIAVSFETLTHASPTLYGPSGLIEVPTAESLKYKEFNVAVDYAMNGASSNMNQLYYKLNLGTFKSWEIGVVGGTTPTEGMYLNLKYYLLAEDTRLPLAIAIGASNLSSKHNSSVYMVASKLFDRGIQAHFGFKATFVQELDASVMAGIEYMSNNQLAILADVAGENKIYKVNAGIRYAFTETLGFRVYGVNIFSPNNNSAISLGLSWSKFL